MVKKIKMTKGQYRKLSKSWLGIIVILGILGFNFYQEYKPVSGSERFEVTLNQCVDGDTAWFDIDGKKTKVRFLYIDTPESTNQIEPYGKEASNYTCNSLKKASKIVLEYDSNSTKEDKYGRRLAWVFVDGELLQKKLVNKGYAKVAYLYGDYKYTDELKMIEKSVKSKKLGVWSDSIYEEDTDSILDEILEKIFKYVRKEIKSML